jgi:hypothetical protein
MRKLFKYDPVTKTMVEINTKDLHLTGEGEPFQEAHIGILSDDCPVDHSTGEIKPEHKRNIRDVLRKTDAIAEKENRRDCLKIQDMTQRMRERYGIEE